MKTENLYGAPRTTIHPGSPILDTTWISTDRPSAFPDNTKNSDNAKVLKPTVTHAPTRSDQRTVRACPAAAVGLSLTTTFTPTPSSDGSVVSSPTNVDTHGRWFVAVDSDSTLCSFRASFGLRSRSTSRDISVAEILRGRGERSGDGFNHTASLSWQRECVHVCERYRDAPLVDLDDTVSVISTKATTHSDIIDLLGQPTTACKSATSSHPKLKGSRTRNVRIFDKFASPITL